MFAKILLQAGGDVFVFPEAKQAPAPAGLSCCFLHVLFVVAGAAQAHFGPDGLRGVRGGEEGVAPTTFSYPRLKKTYPRLICTIILNIINIIITSIIISISSVLILLILLILFILLILYIYYY